MKRRFQERDSTTDRAKTNAFACSRCKPAAGKETRGDESSALPLLSGWHCFRRYGQSHSPINHPLDHKLTLVFLEWSKEQAQ